MGAYDDIIGLQRPKSTHHTPMPMSDRAAQFSPFSALSGYEEAIEESARHTDEPVEPGDDTRLVLDARLRMLLTPAAQDCALSVTYFEADARKAGGSYQTYIGQFRRILESEQSLEFTDGRRIPLQSILELDGDLFEKIDF